MASEVSLVNYASRTRQGKAWVDSLPDEVFNQVWDGRHGGTVGKSMAASWLRSLGYDDASVGKVETVLTRERR